MFLDDRSNKFDEQILCQFKIGTKDITTYDIDNDNNFLVQIPEFKKRNQMWIRIETMSTTFMVRCRSPLSNGC